MLLPMLEAWYFGSHSLREREMPSHLSRDPEDETSGKLLCPRNLISGPRINMAGRTLFPGDVGVVVSNGCFQATNPQTWEFG
jgi:hypothetical protein